MESLCEMFDEYLADAPKSLIVRATIQYLIEECTCVKVRTYLMFKYGSII